MNEPDSLTGRTIAIFDFDGTLAAKDSLWPFLVAYAGLPRCLLAALWAMVRLPFKPADVDRRTAFKDSLLKSILSGVRVSDLKPAIDRMRSWPCWLPTVEALKEHHATGAHIVIATGSLDLYIREMLGSLPYDAILATDMDVLDGVLTGTMALGNCVRKRKAQRVAAYLKAYGPFTDSWAYGNAPHDLPMMELVNHRVVV